MQRNFMCDMEGADGDSGLKLEVYPPSALIDEKIRIRASGLFLGQCVTLASKVLTDFGDVLMAYAHYIANEEGIVDVQTMSSHGGSYAGQ